MNPSNPPATTSGVAPGDLVERHGHFLRSLARALVRDESAALDLEQETWRVALEHGQALREPRAWLAATVRRLAWTSRRSERRRMAREQHAAKREVSSDESLDIGDLLQRALRQLDEPFRGVVIARYLEGLSPREIADRDGVPLGTVKSQLKRGLAKLRIELDGEFNGERRAWCQVLMVGLPLGSVSTNSSTVAPGSPKLATVSLTSGGLATGLIAMKLAVLAVASVLGLILLSVTGFLRTSPLALDPLVAERSALSDAPDNLGALSVAGPATGRSAASAPQDEATPSLAATFSLSLAVQVFDELGRPAPRVAIQIAPEDHPLNVVGFTDSQGALNVTWESRTPTMTVGIRAMLRRVEIAGIRRVTVRAGVRRKVRMQGPTLAGSKYSVRLTLVADRDAGSGVTTIQDGGPLPLGCDRRANGDIVFRSFRPESEEPEDSVVDFEISSLVVSHGVVSGVVVDSQGIPVPGYPVCGIEAEEFGVMGSSEGRHPAVTDADGQFTIAAPAGPIYCTAGPDGQTVGWWTELGDGDTQTWNPVITRANDVMIQVQHQGTGDVKNIIVETSFDDGETLWVGRARTSERGYATILNWPAPTADVAMIAPEKIAAVPVCHIYGVPTGELFHWALPKDSELTVLRVTGHLVQVTEPLVVLKGFRIFDDLKTAGVCLPAFISSEGSYSLTLPGGTWQVQEVWDHGMVSPTRSVHVDGEQPVDMGALRPPVTAELIIPRRPQRDSRLTVARRMEAIDSLVYDSIGEDASWPQDQVLLVPPGPYLLRLVNASGRVMEQVVVAVEGQVPAYSTIFK